jgi:hypothetical protein
MPSWILALPLVLQGGNPWFDNGEFFTQFSPFGKDYPEGTFASFEVHSCLETMVSRFRRIVTYMVTIKPCLFSTLGRDLYRADNPAAIATENFILG